LVFTTRRVPLNIIKEWERDPPHEPMTSMPALWYDFKRRREDPRSPVCRFRDNIPDWCAEQSDGMRALSIAVRSIRPNGKMHNHQSKVSRALPRYEQHLLSRYDLLVHAASFAQLYIMLEMFATPGIGPMTIYDVAVRFGAWLELEPDRIYIHAGTSAGLRALGLKPWPGEMTMPMEVLPRVLRRKPADEVEDFLCTYRLAFERLPA
jgi:hypothetical protein